MPVLNGHALIQERAAALRNYHKKSGLRRAELDVSGGVDSAVMLGLLVEAIGADNITAVHSKINTNPEQTSRAVALSKALGVKLINIDLTGTFESLRRMFLNEMDRAGYAMGEVEGRIASDPTILGSIRSCLRAPVGRGLNRLSGGGIRHGTGNEDEDRFLRFFQKGGDGEVDSNPIEMLSKTEVFQLSFALGEHFPKAKEVYRTLIDTKPSADLWGTGDAHNDEDEIKNWLNVPLTYGRVESQTGKIKSVGTIERIARFLDRKIIYGGETVAAEVVLFGEAEPDFDFLADLASAMFKGFYASEIRTYLQAARIAEARTYHKSNISIPIIGNRRDLVDNGIISNEMPAR